MLQAPAAAALLVLAAATSASAAAQDALSPLAAPVARSVPDAVDQPYPGVIDLRIDASDLARRVFRVTQTIPLKPGARTVTVLYPQWLPGHHAPRGTLAELADLRFTVGGRPVRWTRDPVEVFAFHVALPEGARELTARFVYTSPLTKSEGRIVVTDEMQNLQWEKVSLYPAGHYVRRIRVRPMVTFPGGWHVATALGSRTAPSGTRGGTVTWAETDYATLVDSPVFAGRHFARWDLGHQVALNVFADEPEQLAATPEQIAAHRALVDEALATFGGPAFDRYDFLLALTDRMGSIGLEHRRSSENQLEPKAFLDWDRFGWDRTLLPHELAHSWNGKYRRPAALWTPDYRQPMQDNLLWVYEGQTQFWGIVHAARAGLTSADLALGQLASIAGAYTEQAGRGWRSVEDTTHDPIIAARKPKPFASLTRGEDYYNEGALVWLEVDQIIRRGSGGRRGLDDFARIFFAGAGRVGSEATYTFADVVAALDQVHRHDWAALLSTRVSAPGQPPPLQGIALGGYRLQWRDTPNPYDQQRMEFAKSVSLTHSLGLAIEADGTVAAARWGSPAFDAGVVGGSKIVAVNGRAYDHDRIRAAIAAAARRGGQPLQLLVQRGDSFRTVAVDYRGGLRWPWLERVDPNAGLDRLLAPRRR